MANIIPRNLQIPEIRGEPENQRVRREKLVLEKFKTEIDLLQMRGKYNEDKFQSIDHEVYLHFQKNLQPYILERIIKLWNDDCLKGYMQCQTIFTTIETLHVPKISPKSAEY